MYPELVKRDLSESGQSENEVMHESVKRPRPLPPLHSHVSPPPVNHCLSLFGLLTQVVHARDVSCWEFGRVRTKSCYIP